MRSIYVAQPIKSNWCRHHLLKTIRFFISDSVHYMLRPLIPYELAPRQPCEELPREAGEVTDEQLALCQAFFDECEGRRAHVEQKAQWTFTAIAFLLPVFASISVFLIREPTFRTQVCHVSLWILLLAALFLIWSFVSALRAIAIRQYQVLGVHSVISKHDRTFLKYNKQDHAQGLIYCATMNTATINHVAPFVKGAHRLLAFAVFCFALGTTVAGFQVIGASEAAQSYSITGMPPQ